MNRQERVVLIQAQSEFRALLHGGRKSDAVAAVEQRGTKSA